NVSGGQKQRFSIARALTKDAPVLVFDDSFSALDFKTDAKLRRALKSDVKDKTIIIVAQRIGTIKDADEILVLNEGRVAGKGTHSYLMENCDEYREIAFSQLAKEELL
ncbi:MAG: ABC transporter ATP-binding protein/permease, partial [Clostridiales bacterium]|nr:ABC transporter ATP-binding protein/permease [Clostridiales bacterium]